MCLVIPPFTRWMHKTFAHSHFAHSAFRLLLCVYRSVNWGTNSTKVLEEDYRRAIWFPLGTKSSPIPCCLEAFIVSIAVKMVTTPNFSCWKGISFLPSSKGIRLPHRFRTSALECKLIEHWLLWLMLNKSSLSSLKHPDKTQYCIYTVPIFTPVVVSYRDIISCLCHNWLQILKSCVWC